jgi:hypothetical protein
MSDVNCLMLILVHEIVVFATTSFNIDRVKNSKQIV